MIEARRVPTAILTALLALIVGACTGDQEVDPSTISFPEVTVGSSTSTTPIDPPNTPTTAAVPTGGSVAVGLWAEPDPSAPTLAGAMVRAATQPQLFEAGPDGSWLPRLVEPGSDAEGPQLRSASFRLRQGAVWSDGSPIGVDDLRRSADPTFVTDVTAGEDGTITVEFNQPLVNWRMLWSGTSVVEPPEAGIYGGPFRVDAVEPGLSTTLVPNDTWWGDGPHLDEVELVVVPDHAIAMRLFARGELDVLAPWPAVGRQAELEAIADLRDLVIDEQPGLGWWTGLTLDPGQVSDADRSALVSLLDSGFFAATLLKDEVVAIADDVEPGASTLADTVPADTVTITAADDVPMLAVANRAIVLAARDGGGAAPEIREGDSELVEGWIAEGVEAWVGLNYEGPGRGCWTCRYGKVDEVAARLADGGGEPLDRLLADEAVVARWWHPVVVVAHDADIVGPEANGWALGPIWNAHSWHMAD